MPAIDYTQIGASAAVVIVVALFLVYGVVPFLKEIRATSEARDKQTLEFAVALKALEAARDGERERFAVTLERYETGIEHLTSLATTMVTVCQRNGRVTQKDVENAVKKGGN